MFQTHLIASPKRLAKTYEGIFPDPADMKDPLVIEFLSAGYSVVKAKTLDEIEVFWNIGKSRLLVLNRYRDRGCVVERKREKRISIQKASYYPVDRANKIIYNKPARTVDQLFARNYGDEIDFVQGLEIYHNRKEYLTYTMK